MLPTFLVAHSFPTFPQLSTIAEIDGLKRNLGQPH